MSRRVCLLPVQTQKRIQNFTEHFRTCFRSPAACVRYRGAGVSPESGAMYTCAMLARGICDFKCRQFRRRKTLFVFSRNQMAVTRSLVAVSDSPNGKPETRRRKSRRLCAGILQETGAELPRTKEGSPAAALSLWTDAKRNRERSEAVPCSAQAGSIARNVRRFRLLIRRVNSGCKSVHGSPRPPHG